MVLDDTKIEEVKLRLQDARDTRDTQDSGVVNSMDRFIRF
jgi:hypothetical protein